MNHSQFRLRLPVIASLVFGFLATKLDAQDLAGPDLIVPLDGAVLENGRMDRLDVMRWEFEWSSVPNADKYRLMAQGKSAKFPAVNTVLADTRFTKESKSHIIARHQQGWTWKVQARVNGKWGNWSEERTFDLEPLNTDLATIESPTPPVVAATLAHWQLNLKNLNLQNDIEFDQNVLSLKPFATYRRDNSGGGWREDLKFSPDGRFVAIGGREQSRFRSSTGGRIELWHVESGKQTILSDAIATHIHPTWFPVAFSRDSKRLAAADISGHIKIWDLSHSPLAKPRVLEFRDEGRNTSIAKSLCFTPDGKRIFVGAFPTRQLDVRTGQEVVFYEKYAHCLLDPDIIAISPDGKLIAFGGLDQGIHLLDRESAKLSNAFKDGNPFKQIFFHRFLPSGQSHLTAGQPAWSDPMVSITEHPSGRITASIVMQNGSPAPAVSADGTMLAIKDARIKKTEAFQEWRKEYREANSSRGYPTMISLWRIENGKPEFLGQINAGSDEMVRAIGISPSGDTLVTSGAHLRLWNISEVRIKVVAIH